MTSASQRIPGAKLAVSPTSRDRPLVRRRYGDTSASPPCAFLVHFPSGNAPVGMFRPVRQRADAPHRMLERQDTVTHTMSSGRAMHMMATGRLRTPTQWPPRERKQITQVIALSNDGAVLGGWEGESPGQGQGWIGGDPRSPRYGHMARSRWEAMLDRSATQ